MEGSHSGKVFTRLCEERGKNKAKEEEQSLLIEDKVFPTLVKLFKCVLQSETESRQKKKGPGG